MNKPVSSRIGLVVLFVVLAVIMALLFSITGRSPVVSVTMGLLVSSALYIGLFLMTGLPSLIHELGHYAAIKLVRWELSGFTAMGFNITKDGDKWKKEFNLDRIVDGQVLSAPKDLSIRKWVFILASGPVAGLIAGGVSLIVARSNSELAFILNLFGWVNIVYSVASFYPYYIKGHPPSDGWNIRLALFYPAICKLMLSLDCLTSLAKVKRPREWELEGLANKYDLPGYEAYWNLSGYWSRLDGGDIEGARKYLDEAWNLIQELAPVKPYQSMLAFEVAMYYTRFVKDEVKASMAYGLGMGADPQCQTKMSYELAKHFVNGNIEEARKLSEEYVNEARTRLTGNEHLISHVEDWYKRILDPGIAVVNVE